ncbi:MAG: hypothetical protein JO318_18790, partial [Chloroflexi bacterium]|nr:hypothetical protein [Chloroflexota bacterium]
MRVLTRRRLLAGIGLATGSLLQACASASTGSSPTAQPEPAAARTSAPAQTGQTVEVVQTGLTADYPNFPELLQLYAKQAPNVKIITGPQQGGSGSTLAQLKTEGSNTQVSLVFLVRTSCRGHPPAMRSCCIPSTKISYDDPTTSASGLIFLVGAIKANGGTIDN